MNRCASLILTVTREAGRFFLTFLSSAGHSGKIPLILDEQELFKISEIVERMVKLNTKRLPLQEEMERVGTFLYALLIGNYEAVTAAYEALKERELRIEIEVRDGMLAQLPWELMCTQKEGLTLFIFHSPKRYLIRRVGQPNDLPQVSHRPVINALVICPAVERAELPMGHGKGLTELSTINYLPFYQTLLKVQDEVGTEAFAFTLLHPSTYERLGEELRNDAYNVLYFIGHGYYDEFEKKSYLLFERGDPAARATAAGTAIPSYLLSACLEQSGIKLVILSGCNSARNDSVKSLSGAAQAIAERRSISAVVGMQCEVPLYTAQAFDFAFFTELARLQPVYKAVTAGRGAIINSVLIANENLASVMDWAIPILLMRNEHLYADQMLMKSGAYRIGLTDQEVRTLESQFRSRNRNLLVKLKEFNCREIKFGHDFLIDCWPVTNQQYKKFVDAKGYHAPKHWFKGEPRFPPGLSMHPVVNVSLHDAMEYCKWAGKRLPSADEWEVIARGPKIDLFPWGNEFDYDRCHIDQPRETGTASVFRYPQALGDYKIWDLVGNVYEWTETSNGKGQIIMGGCWYKNPLFALPCIRPCVDSGRGYESVGFRCVQDIFWMASDFAGKHV
jgi:formylglycine-generating enzyme required for sulfatase activity